MPVSTEESLSNLRLRLKAGDLAAADLINDCLDRIESEDKRIEAWAYVARDEALREARKLDHEFTRKGPRGPLHGFPFGVKDIFDTAGMPTEWGSPLHKGRVPGGGCGACAATARSGSNRVGQDAYDGLCLLRSRADPESTQHGTHARRFVQRVGGRCRRGDGTVLHR